VWGRQGRKSLGGRKGGLSGDGVVAFEGLADVVGGDGTLAADAPEVAAKFDDGGGREGVGFAGIEDERDAVSELAENFLAAFAGGRAGKISAGAGEGDAEFVDEIRDDPIFGPAESDSAGVGGDLEGKTIGGIDNDGERTGPAGFGETKEIVRKIFSEDRGLRERIDKNGKSAVLWTAFDLEDFVDSGEIDGIGRESVKRVRGNGDNRAAV
jgi:hypothetical protein